MHLLVCWWKCFVIQLHSVDEQLQICSFWMLEKMHCLFMCVCPVLWWHMSCPMLWVLPLSCNNTPHCCLKYSLPGKPITLSQSHGFLIIIPLSALTAWSLYSTCLLLHPTHLSASGYILHSHLVLSLELEMTLSHSLLKFFYWFSVRITRILHFLQDSGYLFFIEFAVFYY